MNDWERKTETEAEVPTPRGKRVPRDSDPPPTRPFGVTLIALILTANGITSFVGLFGVAPFQVPWAEPSGPGTPTLAAYYTVSTAVSFLLAYGLWALRRWGYWSVLGLGAVLTVVCVFGAALSTTTAGLLADLAGAAIGVAVVWYLGRGRLKGLFSR